MGRPASSERRVGSLRQHPFSPREPTSESVIRSHKLLMLSQTRCQTHESRMPDEKKVNLFFAGIFDALHARASSPRPDMGPKLRNTLVCLSAQPTHTRQSPGTRALPESRAIIRRQDGPGQSLISSYARSDFHKPLFMLRLRSATEPSQLSDPFRPQHEIRLWMGTLAQLPRRWRHRWPGGLHRASSNNRRLRPLR